MNRTRTKAEIKAREAWEREMKAGLYKPYVATDWTKESKADEDALLDGFSLDRVCPIHFIALPASGRCDYCEGDGVMTIYDAEVLLNLDSRFMPYRDGDRLLSLGALGIFTMWADSPEEAASRMFDIGNRQAVDGTGEGWPRRARSVSVGDVVLVTPNREEDEDNTVVLVVEPLGFKALPTLPRWTYDRREGVAASALGY